MIIAEIGQAHEGNLGIAHSYIDALEKTGLDGNYRIYETRMSAGDQNEWKRHLFLPS